jgi:predicted RNA-binding Zn ribbon-like protein
MNAEANPFVAHGYGDSKPWLDLVNSARWDGFGIFTDMLDNPQWVKTFLHFWKFRNPSQEPFPRAEFRALRALIRTMVETASGGGNKLPLEQLASVNDWMKVPITPKLEEAPGGLRMSVRMAQSGWKETLGNITFSFAQSLIDHGQTRLRICQNNDCRWIFIDSSKGNVRRWCNTATCGNRERVRKARASKKR